MSKKFSKHSSYQTDAQNRQKALTEVENYLKTGNTNSLDRSGLLARLAGDFELSKKISSAIVSPNRSELLLQILKENQNA